MPTAMASVATDWTTAYVLRDFRDTAVKCCFVQDFEPFRFSPGSQWLLAEQTYRFGFHAITAGSWLADLLQREYAMPADCIGYSCDRRRYRQMPRRNPLRRQVLFDARPSDARRGFELGMLVLREVSRRLPDARFFLTGEDLSGYSIPFPHVHAGALKPDELADLYSQCDAALVLSCTNARVMPLEIMACGCPVVSNAGPNVEWLLNENNAVLAEPTVEALSHALIELLAHDLNRVALIRRGLDFVKQTDWMTEARRVNDVLERLCDTRRPVPASHRFRREHVTV
jgi:glycosyltransferase involved in cell wall biosynthesis